jgi:hypothetical protein
MKLTRNQLKKIIVETLFSESFVRDTTVSGIISLLTPVIVKVFNDYEYAPGICDDYNCNGEELANNFITILKNHEIIDAAHVSTILTKLPAYLRILWMVISHLQIHLRVLLWIYLRIIHLSKL